MAFVNQRLHGITHSESAITGAGDLAFWLDRLTHPVAGVMRTDVRHC